MTRRALALTALLLACSPPTDGELPASPSRPAARPEQRKPSPAREPTRPKGRSDKTLTAGAYYQYVDESGRVRFARSLDEVPERQRSTAGHVSVSPRAPEPRAKPQRRQAAAAEEGTERARVVVYTTRSCPWCKTAVDYLDSLGENYVNKDVEEDPGARDEYLRLTNGRAGVPVILIGNKWIQGWDKGKVEQMLAEAPSP